MVAVKPLHFPVIAIASDRLYVGIDVSKKSNEVAPLSQTLLRQHRSFQKCPTMTIENSRIGFEALIAELQRYTTDLSTITVLMEKTGHYHLALKQFLQDQGVEVYEIHAMKRSKNKSDKLDAQRLANTLYTQLALGAQTSEEEQRVRRALPPPELAVRLHGLAWRRMELSRDLVRRDNKLHALCDQLFPELILVFKDPNCATALRLRKHYPTASDIAAASLDDLWKCAASRGRPGRPGLARLRSLAERSIGLRDEARVEALCFEQGQLIDEMRVLKEHRDATDAKLLALIQGTRQGKILLSFGVISPIEAAIIIAAIGNIENFESGSKLKGYFGWAPDKDQTGTSRDSMTLTKGGNRALRTTMYLIGWHAVRHDSRWRELYLRLVPLKCQWDARTKKYKGKNKVLGRIIGQIIGLMYLLLKKDQELLRSLPDGAKLPDPTLYSREIHARGH